jgi:hypothetical protein
MLRIYHDKLTFDEVRLVAEGQLRGPWVEELERSCQPFLGNGRKVSLNLTDVVFADRDGVALLRRLEAGGVELACSPFLSELLRTSGADEVGSVSQ